MLRTTYPEFGERTFSAGRSPYSLVILEILYGAIKKPRVEVSSLQTGTTVPTQIHQGHLKRQKNPLHCPYPELNEPHTGWMGKVQANTLGQLATEETLTLTYDEPVTATHFACWGGTIYRLRDFSVTWYLDGAIVHTLDVEEHNASEWHMIFDPITFDELELTVYKVHPRGGNVQLLFFGPLHRIVFTPDSIRDYTVIEDLVLPGESPLGVVNANSFDLALENSHGWLTPGYQESPFLDLFYPRMLIHPLGGFKMKDGVFELVSLGKFYTADWGGSRLSLETTIYSLDRLSNFLGQKLPPMPPYKDTKPEDFLRILFYSLGLQEGTDFQIDSRITNSPRLCWTQETTYGGAFQKISEAGNFYITCNREGIICAISHLGSERAAQVFTGDNLLTQSTVPQLYKTVINTIDLAVYKSQRGEKSEVWQGSATLPPTGTYTFGEVTFHSPVVSVTEVSLQGIPGVGCEYFRAGVTSAILTLGNPHNTEKKVEVRLHGIAFNASSEMLRIGSSEVDSTLPLTIDNVLIQSAEEAQLLGERLLAFMRDGQRETSNFWRVDLRTELGDMVTIDNRTHGVMQSSVIVKGQQIEFNGGFTGTLMTQKELRSRG